MSSSHKGSRLQLSGNPFVVDFSTAYLDYNNDTSGIQFASLIVPSGNPVVTMRPMEGAFGGGVAIEEGTTNMLPSPTLVGQTGLATCFNNYNISTYSITPDFFIYGTNSQSISATGNNDGSQMNKGVYFNISATSGNRYTASFYGKGWENKGAISFYSSTLTSMSTSSYPKDNGWKQYVCSFTAPSTASHLLYVRPNGNMNYDFSCLINAPQIENKSFATSFVNGTRAKGNLAYYDNGLDEHQGTIAFWYKPDMLWNDTTTSNGSNEGTHEDLFTWGIPGQSNCIWSRVERENKNITFFTASANSIYSTLQLSGNQLIHIAFTWQQGGSQTLYINGKSVATSTMNTFARPTTGYFEIGTRQNGSGYPNANGIISDLIVSPTLMSAEDISSIYLSNRPLFNPYDKRAYAL